MMKVFLIHYPDKFEAEEAHALAEAAEYKVAATLTQRYLSRAKYGIGEGKAQEAADIVREKGLDAVILDMGLTASQSYNLAKLCKVQMKDREKLILEIFAKRASTAEAKLQVELAELSYELPKSLDKVRMALSGRSCFETLSEMDVPESKILPVMNKTDLLTQEEMQDKMTMAGIGHAVRVSAKTGAGVPELLRRISSRLGGPERVQPEMPDR